MDGDRVDIIEKILAALQMVIAVFYFDVQDVNQAIAATLLFVCGLIFFLTGLVPPPIETARRILGRVLLIAGLAFIVKLLIFG